MRFVEQLKVTLADLMPEGASYVVILHKVGEAQYPCHISERLYKAAVTLGKEKGLSAEKILEQLRSEING